MRSKLTADFTEEEVLGQLMEILKKEEPKTAREYEMRPHHWTFDPETRMFQVILFKRDEAPAAPKSRVTAAGPGSDNPIDPDVLVKDCVQCGEPFEAQRSNQVVCSDRCRRLRANKRSSDFRKRERAEANA